MGFDLRRYRTDRMQKRWGGRYGLCVLLVALAAVFWLVSGIGQWQMAKNKPAEDWPSQPLAVKTASSYGDSLQAIRQQAEAIEIREVKYTSQGLLILAAAEDWQTAADFGSRLKALPEIAWVSLNSAELLTRLQDGQPAEQVSFTLLVALREGASDEG